MSKIYPDKEKKENNSEINNEKVNGRYQDIKRNKRNFFKFFVYAILIIIVLGLGLYYNIIQNIFYSFLSVIIILLILALGLGWEYIVLTYIPLGKFNYTLIKENTNIDSWKKIEEEFDLWIASSEQKIKQLKRFSILNYMTAIGLFIFSCIILVINWVYGENFLHTAYQQINPSYVLALVLLFFSLLFLFLHYINQKDITKKQNNLDETIKWIISVKSIHLLGKEHMVDVLLQRKTNK